MIFGVEERVAAAHQHAGTGATSPLSSAPRARVRPMLKYCDVNGLKLTVCGEMMSR